MSKPLDDNDLLLAGKLPEDPEDDCDEMVVPIPEAERPRHQVKRGEGHVAVAFSIEQLASDDRVYQRGLELVTVAASGTPKKKPKRKRFERSPDAKVITKITPARLWTWLSQIAVFETWNGKTNSIVTIDPPPPIVAGVLAAAGEWTDVRPLTGISTTPIISDDGEVRIEPGYDEETGMLYAPDCKPPEIPRHPTHDDAVAAAKMLIGVVSDFPFASTGDVAGWLAALLTPLARPLCPTVPMFVFDANAAGSGKSLLCEIIGRIVSGHPMACGPHVAEDSELRKRILAHAMAGDSLIMVDNAPNGWSVGWPSLDLTLTATEVTDRVLRESRTVRVPNTMTWYLTGNNLGIRGDTARRAVRIRLESPLERPECRNAEDFEHPDIQAWVSAERRSLLGAAITILSAYLRAGRTPSRLPLLGSFTEWSRIVRDAVAWVGLGDVGRLVAAADVDADPRVGAHIQLLDALVEYPKGLTASGMLQLTGGEFCENEVLRDALMELAPSKRGGLGDARRIGFALRELRGRVRTISDGRCARLVRVGKSDGSSSKKSVRWATEITAAPQVGSGAPGGYGGIGGYAGTHAHTAEVRRAPDLIDARSRDTQSGNTPLNPHTPRGIFDTVGRLFADGDDEVAR